MENTGFEVEEVFTGVNTPGDMAEGSVATADAVGGGEGASPVDRGVNITSENLFDLVDSGEITLDEANEFLEREMQTEEADNGGEMQTTEGNTVETQSTPATPAIAGEPEKNFKEFKTQEDFQTFFDGHWNRRYGEMMREQEERDAQMETMLSDLGVLLGVPKENARGELQRRKLLFEAQQQGVEDPERYADMRNLELERDGLKQQLQDREKKERIGRMIADIEQQGAAMTEKNPGFSLGTAMQNEAFAKLVFSLYPSLKEKAVEVAVYAMAGKMPPASPTQVGVPTQVGGVPQVGAQNTPTMTTEPQVPVAPKVRPVEGAISGGMNGQRKPVNYSKMSDEEILNIAERVKNGEKIEV